jgi:hypothetical protein
MLSARQAKLILQDGASIIIDVSCYPHTMFEAALRFKHLNQELPEIKVDYPLEVMEIVLSVIRGETNLYSYYANDAEYIRIVREFYPEYEPLEEYDEEDSEDEYNYDDPLEIPKKRGPNYQKPISEEDEEAEDAAFEEWYDAMERAERAEYYSDF